MHPIQGRYREVTIDDFLSPAYIGKSLYTALFPSLKQRVKTFYDINARYRRLFLMMGVGVGKSTEVLSIGVPYLVYSLCNYIDVHALLDIDQSSGIGFVFYAPSVAIGKEIIANKVYSAISAMPVFQEVRNSMDVGYYDNTLHFFHRRDLSATNIFMEFPNNIRFVLTNNPADIIGMNVLVAVMSEVSHFVRLGKASYTEVSEIYNATLRRIQSRFSDKNYFSRVLIDSSPYDVNLSPIDNDIFGTKILHEDECNLIYTGASWDYVDISSRYPLYHKSGEKFTIDLQRATQTPVILDKGQTPANAEDGVAVPIDLRSSFERDMAGSIREFCGIPYGSTSKLFTNGDDVLSMFHASRPTLPAYVLASQLMGSDTFTDDVFHRWCALFIKSGVMALSQDGIFFPNNRFAKRAVFLDMGETRDILSLSCCNVTKDGRGRLIYSIDFSFNIVPDIKINIYFFVEFLQRWLASRDANIEMFGSDQYQSSVVRDMITKRYPSMIYTKFNMKETRWYEQLKELIVAKRVKSGCNVILKNNLLSLGYVYGGGRGAPVIDHDVSSTGSRYVEEEMRYPHGRAGIYAKDNADSVCGAVMSLYMVYEITPNKIIEMDGIDSKDELELRAGYDIIETREFVCDVYRAE